MHSQRRHWHPTPVLLPGKSHGWRGLEGCSPWGRWGSNMTERLHFHFSLSCIGEGNGNPLQCSCLENPRDRGAWCAAVYGVTQSRTRLKWLSNRCTPTSQRFHKDWDQAKSHQPSLVAQMIKNLSAMQETRVWSLDREDPVEEEMAIHASILDGEFHGQRTLVGYSPWDRKDSDTTERQQFLARRKNVEAEEML